MPLPPTAVDLSAQGLEQVGHALNFVNYHETTRLFVQVKVRFVQYLTIRNPLHIKVDRVPVFCDVLSQRRFADLPRPKQDNTRLIFQCLFNPLSMAPCDHTLHLLHVVEDLQGFHQKIENRPI